MTCYDPAVAAIDPNRQLRWEIKYLAYPYTSWTLEEHEDGEEAARTFRELWIGSPPALNLSMRSIRVDVGDDR